MRTSPWLNTVRLAGLLVWIVVVITPLVVLLSVALKSSAELLVNPLGWPRQIEWANFGRALERGNLGRALLNSLLVTGFSVAGLVVLGSLAAYPLARRSGSWANGVYIYFIAGIMAPFQLAMLPLYKLMKGLALINTYHGAILIYIATSLPFVIFLYTGFIKTVNRELEEAALIDGCGPFRLFWRIVFPLLTPVTSAVVIMNCIFIWNDFLVPLLFLQKQTTRTIPMAIFSFVGQYNSDWGPIFAAIVLASLPMIATFFLLQQYFIKGIASGAVKG